MNKILCENLQKITRNTNVKFCLYGLALYKVYIYTLPVKSFRSDFFMFLNEVSSAHQGCFIW